MEQFIKDNGSINNDMVMVYKLGLMELNIKDIGNMIWLMEKEQCGILTVIYIKESGGEIKLKVMEFISTKIESNTKKMELMCN